MTLYFAICHFSSLDIEFLELPRMILKGFITSILVNFTITGIFGIITIQTCHCMWTQLCVAEIKAVIWQLIDKPIEADLEVTPDICNKKCGLNAIVNTRRNKVMNCAWNKGMRDAIQFIVSTLHNGLSLQWGRNISSTDFVTWKNVLRLNLNAQSSCVKIYAQISLIGVKLLREVIKSPHIFYVRRTTLTWRGFTTFAYLTLAGKKWFWTIDFLWYGFILLGMQWLGNWAHLQQQNSIYWRPYPVYFWDWFFNWDVDDNSYGYSYSYR